MALDAVLHNAIENYNVLARPTEYISEKMRAHPNLYKLALLVNHIFRSAAMAGFMLFLPFSLPVNSLICLGGSLFYRLTVEINCAYKFALPAFAGSVAFLVGKTALAEVVSGAAFASINAFGAGFATLIPLCAYTAYIALTVNYDVGVRCS